MADLPVLQYLRASSFGFAIGHVAAVDVESPEAVVSPGGVGESAAAKAPGQEREAVAELCLCLSVAGVGPGISTSAITFTWLPHHGQPEVLLAAPADPHTTVLTMSSAH